MKQNETNSEPVVLKWDHIFTRLQMCFFSYFFSKFYYSVNVRNKNKMFYSLWMRNLGQKNLQYDPESCIMIILAIVQ